MNRYYLQFLFLILSFSVFCQQKPVLGNDYLKYIKEMDAYFKNENNKKSKGFKHYMRWRHKYASKIGWSNQFKNFEAINQIAIKDAERLVDRSSKTRHTHGGWTEVGPSDYTSPDPGGISLGRINCLAFHPTNSNILFVGTAAGGVWKTLNHGNTWECISNNFASISITDIVVNPDNANIIYILTGDGDGQDNQSIGVLKTTDGGLTWKPTKMMFGIEQARTGFCLRKHPYNHEILFLGLKDTQSANDTTLWVTYNGGENWFGRLTDVSVFDIEFKPGSALVSYAATNNGIFKSINNGFLYFPSSTGLPDQNTYVRLAIASSNSDPDNLYVLCGGSPSSGTFTGLYKSTDSGNSYSIQSNSPNILSNTLDGSGTGNQADYDLCLVVDPMADATVYSGGVTCWKSLDSGENWNLETWWSRAFEPTLPFVHADWHNIYFHNSNIYACTDGGVFYSNNNGDLWTEISKGITMMQFYNIDVNNNEWLGGAQDNGTNLGDVNTNLMTTIIGGDGMGCVYNQYDAGELIISSQNDLVRKQGSSACVINNSGDFWYNELAMATNVENIFAIKDYVDLIRGSENSGDCDWTWNSTGNAALGIGITKGFAQGINNPAIMYVASEGRLLKSTSIYTTPSAPWDTLPHPALDLYYEKIIVDSFDANKLWVVCGGYDEGKKVYRSTNGGMSWTNISGSIPNIPMRRIVAKTSGIDELYVGTEIGVFYWNENINDWIYFTNGLPSTSIFDLEFDSGYLYAGTHGRGIWRTQLYSPCVPNLTLTMPDPYSIYTPGTQVYSASNIITSNRVYNGSLGTNIIYNAENKVDLTEGFWAKQGTTFTGTNDGCP